MKTTSFSSYLIFQATNGRFSANNTLYVPDNPQELTGKKENEKGGTRTNQERKEEEDKRAEYKHHESVSHSL